MGIKGNKRSSASSDSVESFFVKIETIVGITSKAMFGGYGVFHEGTMFALVNSEGGIFLKSDETNRKKFDKHDALQHARMTYFQVPATILEDRETLINWVQESIQISK